MTEAVSQILSEVKRLSGEERAEVAYEVLCSLGPPDKQQVEQWEAELARRVEEIQSGRAVGRPAEEVFARLRGRRS
ncbi:MAG: addiction module protein [Planctomycetes bacterium]|nr:addiction module protein [Planctomycetota bacterium]